MVQSRYNFLKSRLVIWKQWANYKFSSVENNTLQELVGSTYSGTPIIQTNWDQGVVRIIEQNTILQ